MTSLFADEEITQRMIDAAAQMLYLCRLDRSDDEPFEQLRDDERAQWQAEATLVLTAALEALREALA